MDKAPRLIDGTPCQPHQLEELRGWLAQQPWWSRYRLARELGTRQVQIEFADDGVGIAAEHLPRIFEPFFTTRRAEGSIGLGLHSIYNIVRSRLRGEIDVHSSPGQGTRFIIRIARELPTPAPDPAPALPA